MATNGEKFGPYLGSRGKAYRVHPCDDGEGGRRTWDIMRHVEIPEGVTVAQQITTRAEARRQCRELNEQHERNQES